jgi:hypothetical protein
MRRYVVILGLLFLVAAPARSDIFFDRFDRAPAFWAFMDIQWLMAQVPNNAAAPHADKVLTISGTAPDINKDGFVTARLSKPGDSIGSADPMGYEALHSSSFWGNVRVILELPVYRRADSDIPASDVDSVAATPPSPSTAPVPEPASLSLLLAGAACALRRRRR